MAVRHCIMVSPIPKVRNSENIDILAIRDVNGYEVFVGPGLCFHNNSPSSVANVVVVPFCACTILESKLEITNLETIYSGTLGIRLKENFYKNHGKLNY